MQRIRITYAKTEAMRYTSNLDVHKAWERTLRRAQLPLAYSQGFHPQPKMNQACPLPLGQLSQVEMLDAWLDPDQPLNAVAVALHRASPPGFDILQVEAVDLAAPALQKVITAAEFEAILLQPHDRSDLAGRVERLLAAESLPRVFRGKSYDLRPLVLALELLSPADDGLPRLFMRLMVREGATGRVEEVLSALELDPFDARIERTRLVI